LPEEAEFLRVRLRVSDEKWQSLDMRGWARTEQELFFYDGTKWKYGPPGSVVFGYIVARELELETRQWGQFNDPQPETEKGDSQGAAFAEER
jgi:hypothetical protein